MEITTNPCREAILPGSTLSELTREQVEFICHGNGAPYETLQQILLTDSALRAQLAQVTQDCDRLREQLTNHEKVIRIVKKLKGSDAHHWAGGQVAMLKDNQGEWIRRDDLLRALKGM